MRKKYIMPVFAMTMAVTAAGFGTVFGAGTLKVGVRDDIMNFGYLNADTGQYYGFEVDLARQMTEKMGYSDVEYITVTPDDREAKLDNGEVDCVVAAYSITEARQEKYDFSPAYYEDVSGIVVERSSLIQDFAGLVGYKIGGLTGSNTEDELKAKMIEEGLITEKDVKNTSFVYCDSYEDMAKRLQEGTLDAVCMDGCIAHSFMDDTSILLEENINTQEYGVATVKGSALSEKTAQAIQKLLDDGSIDALKDKWD